MDNLWTAQGEVKRSILTWPQLGTLKMQIPQFECEELSKSAPNWNANYKLLSTEHLNTMNIRTAILDNFTKEITPLQSEVFQILNRYNDFCHPNVQRDKLNELRLCYSAHILNHMLKTRNRILKHNMKLAATPNIVTIPDSYRDQGLARPKVLVILPFRKCAYQIVTNMGRLLYGKNMGM